MNKVLLGVNVALVICVGVLFYQVNSGKAENEITSVPAPKKDAKLMPVTSKIAFYRNDSIAEQYGYIKDKRKTLQDLEKSIQGQLQRESAKLQARYNELMQKAQTMTQQESEAAQMELGQGQQKLEELKYKLEGDLAQKSAEIQKELFDKVQGFLKKYNEKQQFDYILSYVDGGQVMLAKDTLDITSDVVNGLNAEYQQSKKK